MAVRGQEAVNLAVVEDGVPSDQRYPRGLDEQVVHLSDVFGLGGDGLAGGAGCYDVEGFKVVV